MELWWIVFFSAVLSFLFQCMRVDWACIAWLASPRMAGNWGPSPALQDEVRFFFLKASHSAPDAPEIPWSLEIGKFSGQWSTCHVSSPFQSGYCIDSISIAFRFDRLKFKRGDSVVIRHLELNRSVLRSRWCFSCLCLRWMQVRFNQAKIYSGRLIMANLVQKK